MAGIENKPHHQPETLPQRARFLVYTLGSATLIAAVYPAWRLSRLQTAEALRGEWPMPTMRKKADLPVKICPVCQRPFAWRKKWRKDWENVIYCSDKCCRSHQKKG